MKKRTGVSVLWFFVCGVCVCVSAGCSVKGGTTETVGEGGTLKDGGVQDVGGALKWYQTCGDPACGGHRPDPNVGLCTTEKVGDVCAVREQKCDPKNDCNAHYVCADKDPKSGSCPISQRRAKRDIRYLSDADKIRYHRALRDLRLATYRYRHQGAKGGQQVGFIIEDNPPASLLYGKGERVNLYSYISMLTASLQVQAKQIAELQAQLRARRLEVAPVCLETPHSVR